MRAILVLILLVSFPVFAEELRVYNDQDLEKYNNHTIFDQETIVQKDADLRQWEKEKEIKENLLREKREAEEKQEVEQKQRVVTKEQRVSQKAIKESNDNSKPPIKKRKT